MSNYNINQSHNRHSLRYDVKGQIERIKQNEIIEQIFFFADFSRIKSMLQSDRHFVALQKYYMPGGQSCNFLTMET